MKLKTLLIILLYFYPLFWTGGSKVFAHNEHIIDSLETQLKNHNAKKIEMHLKTPSLYDTTAATILYELSKACWGNYDKSLEYGKQSLKIAQQIGYKKGIGFAYYTLGVVNQKSDSALAVRYTNTALKIGEQINDKRLIASTHVNLGTIYYSQNKYQEAIKQFYTALKLAEEINDQQLLIWCYNNFSFVYSSLNRYQDALNNLFAVLKIYQEQGDKWGIAYTYDDIGSNYSDLGEHDKAIKYNLEAIKIKEELGDKKDLIYSYLSAGYAYQETGNYSEALKYYFNAKKMSEELNNTISLGNACEMIGQTYFKQGNYDASIQYLTKGLNSSESRNFLENIRTDHQFLADAYHEKSLLKNYSKLKQNQFAQIAMRHYKLFVLYQDSILKSETLKIVYDIKIKYDSEKQQQQIVSLTKDKQLKQAEAATQKTQRNFLIGACALVLLLIGVIINRYLVKSKASREIEKTYSHLKQTQEQLVQSGKLAALGKMTADVAILIKAPIANIKTLSPVGENLVKEYETVNGEQQRYEILDKLKTNLSGITASGTEADKIVKEVLMKTRKQIA